MAPFWRCPGTRGVGWDGGGGRGGGRAAAAAKTDKAGGRLHGRQVRCCPGMKASKCRDRAWCVNPPSSEFETPVKLTRLQHSQSGKDGQRARHSEARPAGSSSQLRLDHEQGALQREEEHPPACRGAGGGADAQLDEREGTESLSGAGGVLCGPACRSYDASPLRTTRLNATLHAAAGLSDARPGRT